MYYPIELFPIPAGVGVVERVEGRLGEALNSFPSDSVWGVCGMVLCVMCAVCVVCVCGVVCVWYGVCYV